MTSSNDHVCDAPHVDDEPVYARRRRGSVIDRTEDRMLTAITRRRSAKASLANRVAQDVMSYNPQWSVEKKHIMSLARERSMVAAVEDAGSHLLVRLPRTSRVRTVQAFVTQLTSAGFHVTQWHDNKIMEVRGTCAG